MGKTIKLLSCPFCGQRLELELYDEARDENGCKLEDIWVVNGHTEYGCMLDSFFDNLPAGMSYDDAVSFAIEWNKRAQVKCGACKWFQFGATPDDELPHFCRLHGSDMVNEWGSCSYGERG